MNKRKYLRFSLYAVIICFAFIGFGLTSAFFAVKFRLTDDPGTVDANDRKFQTLAGKIYTTPKTNNLYLKNKQYIEIHSKLSLINEFYPLNASLILNAFSRSQNIETTLRMIDAAELRLSDNQQYQKLKSDKSLINNYRAMPSDSSIYAWMNISEWSDLKTAIVKEKKMIDSVSRITGVESRMIVMAVIGEQIRLFNSKREVYKKYIGPLKVLSTETKFSLGVTGIKDATAQKTERFLKSPSSPFYLGKQYENLITYKTLDSTKERFDKLTDYHNHYYSYLYAAIIIKQVKMQWEKAGYNIVNRPEILATLFNLGYEVSIPKSNPCVGGSRININNIEYTFGSLSYDFYYSGELFNEFPITDKKFI